MKTLLATNSTIVLALLFAAWPTVSAAQASSALCAGYTGAAYGQCVGAAAVGCDGTATEPKGCANLAQLFETLTGNSPPWDTTRPTDACPCFSKESLRALFAGVEATGGEIRWSYLDGYFGWPSRTLYAVQWQGNFFQNGLAFIEKYNEPAPYPHPELGACPDWGGISDIATVDACWHALALILHEFDAVEDKSDIVFPPRSTE